MLWGRALKGADERRNTKAGLDLLSLVAQNGKGGEQKSAYASLAKDYANSPEIITIAWTASKNIIDLGNGETFLDSIARNSTDDKVKGFATLSLARYFHEQFRVLVDLKRPRRQQRIESSGQKDELDWLRTLDQARLKVQALKYYRETIEHFAAVRSLDGDYPPLESMVESGLFQLENLEIGCKAPAIIAEDLTGKQIRTSDYQGKVLVITFWATWCAPYMAALPNEQGLADRMKDRPFALLGINGDEDQKTGLAAAKSNNLTWPSIWDGGRYKGLSEKWGISLWPTVFVIDGDGIVRDDSCESEELKAMVEQLVGEQEARTKLSAIR